MGKKFLDIKTNAVFCRFSCNLIYNDFIIKSNISQNFALNAIQMMNGNICTILPFLRLVLFNIIVDFIPKKNTRGKIKNHAKSNY